MKSLIEYYYFWKSSDRYPLVKEAQNKAKLKTVQVKLPKQSSDLPKRSLAGSENAGKCCDSCRSKLDHGALGY